MSDARAKAEAFLKRWRGEPEPGMRHDLTAEFDAFAAAETARADAAEALVGRMKEGLTPCQRCRGTGAIPVFCKDPQCGDSTWDHECGDGSATCPDCGGKDHRKLVAALLADAGQAGEEWRALKHETTCRAYQPVVGTCSCGAVERARK